MTSPRSASVPPLVHLALLAVQLMFASLPVAGKFLYAYGHMGPLGVAAARTGGAAAVFWMVIILSGRRQPLERPSHFWKLVVYGILGVTINQIFFLTGLHYTTAVNASVLVSTIPIFTAFLVILLGQERARPMRAAGILLAFAGVGLVTGIDQFDLSSQVFRGNVLIVVNAFSYSLFLVLSRPMLSTYSPLTVTAWILVFGSFFTVPVGAVSFWNGAAGFGAGEWGILAFLVAVPTVGAYFLNSWCLKRAPASVVAAYIYLQPVTAAVLAFALLGERFTLRLLFGALTIFAGIYLAGRSRG